MKSETDIACRKAVFTYGDHFCSWWTRTVPTLCSNAILLTEQALSCFSCISSKSQTDGFAGRLVTRICHIRINRNRNPTQKSTLSLIRLLSTDPRIHLQYRQVSSARQNSYPRHWRGRVIQKRNICFLHLKKRRTKQEYSFFSLINPMCWVTSVTARSHWQILSKVFSHFRFVFVLGNKRFGAKAEVWLPALPLCSPLSDSDTFFLTELNDEQTSCDCRYPINGSSLCTNTQSHPPKEYANICHSAEKKVDLKSY